MILDKSLEYFAIFSEKDIDGLESMFSDNVCLRDWDILANGKAEVLAANQDIFNSVNTIVVSPIRVWDFLSHEDNVVIAELLNGEAIVLPRPGVTSAIVLQTGNGSGGTSSNHVNVEVFVAGD